MRIRHLESMRNGILAGIERVRRADADEVGSYLEECVGGIAAHYAIGNVQCEKVDDIDYWEVQTEGFEAGLKVGAAIREDEKVYTGYVGEDDGEGIYVSHCFWFVGPMAGPIVKQLRDETAKWIAGLRKEKGLLPFPD